MTDKLLQKAQEMCAIGFIVVGMLNGPAAAMLAGCGVWMLYTAQGWHR